MIGTSVLNGVALLIIIEGVFWIVFGKSIWSAVKKKLNQGGEDD